MGAMPNGQPRRTVRSRRSSSIIAQAIAILARYGGSWWQSGPEYSFTGSDGTGAAGDGSDVGYGVDRCATYGAELVSNGDFSQGATGWTLTQPTSGVVGVVNGRLRINSADGSLANAVQYNTLTIGKLYQVTGNANVAFGSVNVFLGSGTSFQVSASGDFSFVGVCSGTANMELKRFGAVACDASFDNISVREIIGRPLFQATTGFKPKLRRVPKKLGPELAPATTSTAGWVAGQGGTLASDGSALTITNGTASEGVARFNATFKANTAYALSGEVTASVNGSGSFAVGGTRLALLGTGFKNFTITPSADAASGAFGTNSSVVGGYVGIKNVSVREVLEWTWAWVFDGVDDKLAVAATENPSAETLIVAYDYLNTSTAAQAVLGKRSGNFGVMIRRENTLTTQGYAMTGTAVESAVLAGAPLATAKAVSTVAAASGSKRYRRNGVQQSTTSGVYAAAPSTLLTLGTEGGVGAPAAAEIYAAAYAPAVIPDAELLIIERAMAQLAGVTI